MSEPTSEGFNKTLLIVVLGILTSLAPLSIDMYLPAFISLEQFFQTDAAHVQLTLSSFFIAFAIGQLIYGPLADRYGRKVMLYGGLAVFIVASLACVFAESIESLIVLRFFQAIGASAGIVIARAMVSDLFVAREAAQVYSAMMLVMGAAPMLAPLMGGYLLSLFGWGSIFEALAAFGVIALVLTHFLLQETRGPNPSTDLSPKAVLGRYFALLKNRRYVGYTLAGGMGMAGMFAYIASSPFVFIDHYGIDTDHFGWFFGVNALAFIAFAQINGRMLKYKTPFEIVRIAIIVQVVVSVLLLLQSYLSGELYSVVVPLFFQIGLLGFLVPNMTALALAHFKANAGSASAFLGSMQFLVAGLVSMFVSSLHSDSPVTLALAMFLCAVVSFLIFQFVCRRHHGADDS